MMVCDEAQYLANHTTNVAPGRFNTTVTGNTGIQTVFDYEYRSDKRLMIQKNSTGKATGNLLMYDAVKREWEFLFLFSTYYDINWLAINTNERWIGYMAEDFKVQWWFNYIGQSKVTRIFSNLWETPNSNWNLLSNTLTQIKTDGRLRQQALAWDTSDTMKATE
jgi:hypothetical protein